MQNNMKEIQLKSAQWYNCRVRFDKTMENGIEKKVTEQYVCSADDFTDAEARMLEEMSSYVTGDIEIRGLSLAPFNEILMSNKMCDDRYFQVKVNFMTMTDTGKVKNTKVTYLVQSSTLAKAVDYIVNELSTCVTDFNVCSICETKIMDVFEKKDNE
jgi:hypothetical protein